MTLGKNTFGGVPSRTRDQATAKRRQWRWVLPVLMLAPLGLGAKGCDAAVVGDDCPEGSATAECVAPTDGTPDACGGLLGKTCADGEYCKYELDAKCGIADQTGVCAPVPKACDAVQKPVCACDGTTYGNECEAAMKGISVASLGRCAGDTPPPTSKECGGIAGLPCAPGQYCAYPIDAKCGAADQTGFCADIPTNCGEIYQPVCGCDGKTYSSACDAASASISILSTGACEGDPPPTRACGGIAGLACDKGEFCAYPPDAKCGAADQTGICRPTPSACDAVYRPVCGCDGKTYGNECEAALAGVSVQFEGECAPVPPPAGTVCGGLRGLSCAKDEYCNYPIDAYCGRADATGVCASIPRGCTKEANPVCGCDGTTYGNPCMAAAAGVSIEYAGPCKTSDPAPRMCGGIAGLPCEKGEFCDYSPETKCGAADQLGSCRVPPEACPENYAPVCGCDGKTYGNACHAASASVSVSSEGECPKK